MDNQKIDFVILWVDCNDPKWQQMYNDFTGKDTLIDPNRYRDWGFLKYWFRSVEINAPWVNKIYFVTCGQKPKFLNTSHPKIKCITHDEFIEQKYLPLFNSSAIEMNLFKIEGLSEQFVYFNDDMFLNAPVVPSDFFVNGKPCDNAVLDMVIPMGENDVFYHTVLNDIDIINKYYAKRDVLKKNIGGWLTLRYGKEVIRNICLTPWKYFAGFKNYHLPNSYLKSSFSTMYNREPQAFERTWSHNFRSSEDINQYLIQDYQLCEGLFYPKRKSGKFFEIGPQTEEIVNNILSNKYKMICLNDDKNDIDFDSNRAAVIKAFDTKYPNKSSFEI